MILATILLITSSGFTVYIWSNIRTIRTSGYKSVHMLSKFYLFFTFILAFEKQWFSNFNFQSRYRVKKKHWYDIRLKKRYDICLNWVLVASPIANSGVSPFQTSIYTIFWWLLCQFRKKILQNVWKILHFF